LKIHKTAFRYSEVLSTQVSPVMASISIGLSSGVSETEEEKG